MSAHLTFEQISYFDDSLPVSETHRLVTESNQLRGLADSEDVQLMCYS